MYPGNYQQPQHSPYSHYTSNVPHQTQQQPSPLSSPSYAQHYNANHPYPSQRSHQQHLPPTCAAASGLYGHHIASNLTYRRPSVQLQQLPGSYPTTPLNMPYGIYSPGMSTPATGGSTTTSSAVSHTHRNISDKKGGNLPMWSSTNVPLSPSLFSSLTKITSPITNFDNDSLKEIQRRDSSCCRIIFYIFLLAGIFISLLGSGIYIIKNDVGIKEMIINLGTNAQLYVENETKEIRNRIPNVLNLFPSKNAENSQHAPHTSTFPTPLVFQQHQEALALSEEQFAPQESVNTIPGQVHTQSSPEHPQQLINNQELLLENKLDSQDTGHIGHAERVHVEQPSEIVHVEQPSESVHVEQPSEIVHVEPLPESVHVEQQPESVHVEQQPGIVHVEQPSEIVHVDQPPEIVHVE